MHTNIPYSYGPRSSRPKRSAYHRTSKIIVTLMGCLLVGIVVYISQSSHHIDMPQSTSSIITTSKPQFINDPKITQIISSWKSNYSFNSAVFVQEIDGDHRTASYNPNLRLTPASTYKVYVAYALLHSIEIGKYTMQSPTDDSHAVSSDLSAMILNSDNEAARRLGFLIGWNNINRLLSERGLKNTDINNYQPPSILPVGEKHSTVQDYVTLLSQLQAGTLLDDSNTGLLIGLMKNQHYRERIPAGIPSGVPVADKPGWLSPADGENGYVQNDVAIVYGKRSTYILAIMTTGGQTKPLTDLSNSIYGYLED